MKILSIEITNYKKIQALLLTPDGQPVKVCGTTGQGKTTAISSLWDIMETVGDPIRHEGKTPASKAAIRLVLGDNQTRYIAERLYTSGSTTISIKSEDGKTKIGAKEFKGWVSSLAKNPHKLLDLGPQEQTAALLRAAKVPDGVNLEEIDRNRATAHEAREEARKDVARLKAEVGIQPRKVERIEIRTTLERLQELKGDQATATATIANRGRDIAEVDQTIAELETRLQALKDRRAATAVEKVELEEWLSANVDPQEIETLESNLARSEEINREAQAFEEWTKANEKLTTAQAKFAEHDRTIKDLEAAKRAAVESIVWPIEGLAVQDGMILFRGVPLEQCGNSEKLLVCGSLAAHEISQSKLRVVRLDGIESMSSEDFAKLEKLFEEKDIQVLASRVTRGDLEEGEILIHDGQALEGA